MVRKGSRLWRGTIIDAHGHLMGRLASVVAKQLLRGEKVCVVRCERLNVSGSFIRNKIKFLRFLRYTMISNPKRGIKHHRSPARMFWRVVRGMLPYRKPHGKQALYNLKVFEGVPPPWDKKKRFCCPLALRHLRLAHGRDYCVLGDVASEVGWKHKAVLEELETKRKERSEKYYKKKLQLLKLRKLAVHEVNQLVPKLKLGDPNIKIGNLKTCGTKIAPTPKREKKVKKTPEEKAKKAEKKKKEEKKKPQAKKGEAKKTEAKKPEAKKGKQKA
jgi:large subunit ribosomal protein L13Ae